MQSRSKTLIKIMNYEVKNHKPQGVDPLLRQLLSYNHVNFRLLSRSIIIQIFVIRAFWLKSFVSRLTKSKYLKSVTLIYYDNIPDFIVRKIVGLNVVSGSCACCSYSNNQQYNRQQNFLKDYFKECYEWKFRSPTIQSPIWFILNDIIVKNLFQFFLGEFKILNWWSLNYGNHNFCLLFIQLKTCLLRLCCHVYEWIYRSAYMTCSHWILSFIIRNAK